MQAPIKKGSTQVTVKYSTRYLLLKARQDAITEELNDLKAMMLAEMEAKGLTKVSNDEITVTYVPATEAERLDTKRLRSEREDIYNEYVKFVPVKAQLRITQK